MSHSTSSRRENINNFIVNEHEAASIMRCSVHTLRKDRAIGVGVPYFKIRKRVVYALRDIEHYMNARKIATINQNGEPDRGEDLAITFRNDRGD
jgi:hypothetical protein